MTDKKYKHGLDIGIRPPKQSRGERRVEKILMAARSLIAKNGILNMRMNEIAHRANIPVGSIYQFFTSKNAIIAQLFEDTLENYHEKARSRFTPVSSKHECAQIMREFLFEIYLENRADPLMQDIWGGIQADRELRAIHLWDNEVFVDIYMDMLKRVGSNISEEVLFRRVCVINEMWDGTIRLAITMDEKSADALVEEAATLGIKALELE